MHDDQENVSEQQSGISRRTFVKGAATAAAFSIVPRHVLGGTGFVAPSDRVTLACIGVGAQGTRVMMDFLKAARGSGGRRLRRESREQRLLRVGQERDARQSARVARRPGLGQRIRPGPPRDAIRHGRSWKRITEASMPRGSTRMHRLQRFPRSAATGKRSRCRGGVHARITGTLPISITAMKQRKHVYCQKPMTPLGR